MDERNYNRAQRRAIAKYDAKNAKSINTGELKKSLSLKELYELAERASENTFDAFPFTKKASSLFSWEEHGPAEYGSFSRNIFKTYIEGRSFKDAITALYYVSVILLNVMKHRPPRVVKMSKYHMEPISALFVHTALQYFPLCSESDRIHLEALKKQIKSIDILGMEFEYLDHFLFDFISVYHTGTEIEQYMKNELGMEIADSRELREMADQLFGDMRRLQRYTIRQSLFDDEMSLSHTQGWAVIDPRQMRDVNKISHDEVRLLMKHHNSIAEFVSIRSDQKVEGVEMIVDPQPLVMEVMYPFTANLNLIFKLGADGELYYQTYPIEVSWREIFKKAGHEAAYEFLRFQFIARFFDLVVPREISEQTPSMDGLSARVRRMRSEQPLARPIQILRDLITPRRLILRNGEAIKHAQDRESEERRQQRQFLGRVGHPMRLRQGYRPHPDSRKWAKDDGFLRELEDNETWCRPVDSPVPVVHRQKGHKNYEQGI